MNDIAQNKKTIQDVKNVLSQYLKHCNEKRTPYVCNLKSTKEGYKEVEDFVLRVIACHNHTLVEIWEYQTRVINN